MKVNLTYFKDTGKYYSEGSYETEKEHLFSIFQEVQQKVQDRILPGLVRGCSEFIVGIDVPDHPNNHPRLIVPSTEEIQKMKTYQVRLVLEELAPEESERFPALCRHQLETHQVRTYETEEEGRTLFEAAQEILHRELN